MKNRPSQGPNEIHSPVKVADNNQVSKDLNEKTETVIILYINRL